MEIGVLLFSRKGGKKKAFPLAISTANPSDPNHKTMNPFHLLAVLAVLFAPALASEEDTLTNQAPLRVGLYVQEPFVINLSDDFQGYSVDLWKEISADIGRKSEFITFTTIPELLNAVSAKQVDVGVGGLFITGQRLQQVDFTQPFLHGGLQIMINEKRGNSLAKLWNGLRESGHLEVFGIGFLFILVCTILLTIAERRWNREFHPDWTNGLAESFYHVMSIAMTGKSSHKGIPGPWGRILAAIWIAFGVAVVAYITSSVTSVMTVNKLRGTIRGPQDLPGHRVAAVTGTLGSQYCSEHHLETVVCEDLKDAVQSLLSREVDAVVHDAMTLQWFDSSHPELPITEVGAVFDKKFYGFALPISSSLRHEINKSIQKQNESGFLETLRKHYFGDIQ